MSSTMKAPDIETLQKEIEDLTREKASLLKIISHDIRSPFNRMFALLQLFEFEFDAVTPEQKQYIDQMYMSVFGGMEMVKNLRDSRAIDEGKISIYAESINVKSVLDEALKGLSTQAKLKGINIEVKTDSKDPDITGDRTLLLKIFENILSNGIKYSEKNAEVFIDLETEEDRVILSFTDSGLGIPEEEIDQAFDKFKKLSTLPTLGENTSGLGLYLSKHYLDLMNGKIELRNGENAGLVVTLEFPLAKKGQE